MVSVLVSVSNILVSVLRVVVSVLVSVSKLLVLVLVSNILVSVLRVMVLVSVLVSNILVLVLMVVIFVSKLLLSVSVSNILVLLTFLTSGARPLGMQLQSSVLSAVKGDLHFAYARLSDQLLDEKVYKCVVFNPHLDLRAGGSYTRISVQPAGIQH